MTSIFHTLIYQPLLNLTVGLSTLLPGQDMGMAIIALTILIRALFLPLSLRAIRSQRALNALAPQMEALKEQHKNDTAAQGEAIMKLYRDHKVNPLAGCLPMLVQIPVLIGLYRVFLNLFKPDTLSALYAFIPHPAAINHQFLGLLDISAKSPLFAILAGILQYLQLWLSSANQPAANKQVAAMNTQMLYFFPVMIIVISWNLPAGLALYWVTTTAFSVGEQLYVRKTGATSTT